MAVDQGRTEEQKGIEGAKTGDDNDGLTSTIGLLSVNAKGPVSIPSSMKTFI